MNNITSSVVLLLALLSAGYQTAPSGELQSAQRSFSIVLHADPERSLKAFGPAEEKRWAPEWDPKFISTEGDASDPDFAVFKIAHGASESIWTLASHDRQRGTLQYVVFNPGKMLTVIDVRCVSAGEHLTRATVTYRKTALAVETNSQVDHFAQHFADEREHWEESIDKYLQSGIARHE